MEYALHHCSLAPVFFDKTQKLGGNAVSGAIPSDDASTTPSLSFLLQANNSLE
jgi:hypothetical protein